MSGLMRSLSCKLAPNTNDISKEDTPTFRPMDETQVFEETRRIRRSHSHVATTRNSRCIARVNQNNSLFRWPRATAFFHLGSSARLSPNTSKSFRKCKDWPILLSVRPKSSMMDSCDSGFESTSSSASPPPKKGLGSSIFKRIFQRSSAMSFNVLQNNHKDPKSRKLSLEKRIAPTDGDVTDSSPSLSNSELHHHLEHNSDLQHNFEPNKALLEKSMHRTGAYHSSCNSVLSSSADSGQYSSPEHSKRQLLKWSIRDALSLHQTPLRAPALVKAVINTNEECEKALETVDAVHILECLSAAGASSAGPCGRRRSIAPNVSITVGMDTRLMLSQDLGPWRTRPALGTAALDKTTPTKPLRHTRSLSEGYRSKISTVYPKSPEQHVQVNSLVGKTLHCSSRYCTEKVTVNGQHPCQFALRTPDRFAKHSSLIMSFENSENFEGL